MTENHFTDERLDAALRSLGQEIRAFRDAPLTDAELEPLTAAQLARARDIVKAKMREATTHEARDTARVGLGVRLASLLGIAVNRIQSAGSLLGDQQLSPHGAFAAPAGEWRKTVDSEDGLLSGTLLVSPDRGLVVAFESKDIQLAGREVAYALLVPSSHTVLEGRLVLQKRGEAKCDVARNVGALHDIAVDNRIELQFGLVNPA